MLSGKNILIGITGGIAAYKICELVRMYKRENANVQVVCTPNALNFVSILTLQTLSANDVATEQFTIDNFKPEHISFADSADVFVIAPATANTISKLANGICDNLLTSIACAFKKPIIIAPAMNSNMWSNPAIQENLEKLITRGFVNVPPETGFLACGTTGDGRLAALDKIFNKTIEILTTEKPLKGQKIVITAGGTIEEIDPVRYISNYSSGKMGIALADFAHMQGANVVLITTKDVEKPYSVKKVKSALDMEKAVKEEYNCADLIIMAAAVADYRVKNKSGQKMKKSADVDEITLELVKNPDILRGLCAMKNCAEAKDNQGGKNSEEKASDARPIIVGFCAETENLIENAKSKIAAKGCDFIVANDVSRKDIGFSSDENEVYIINKNLDVKKLDKQSKNRIAQEILKEVYAQSGNLQNNQ